MDPERLHQVGGGGDVSKADVDVELPQVLHRVGLEEVDQGVLAEPVLLVVVVVEGNVEHVARADGGDQQLLQVGRVPPQPDECLLGQAEPSRQFPEPGQVQRVGGPGRQRQGRGPEVRLEGVEAGAGGQQRVEGGHPGPGLGVAARTHPPPAVQGEAEAAQLAAHRVEEGGDFVPLVADDRHVLQLLQPLQPRPHPALGRPQQPGEVLGEDEEADRPQVGAEARHQADVLAQVLPLGLHRGRGSVEVVKERVHVWLDLRGGPLRGGELVVSALPVDDVDGDLLQLAARRAQVEVLGAEVAQHLQPIQHIDRAQSFDFWKHFQ